ncbi:hypothetical protein G3N96_04580 [Burkholderia sp. Se-20373]|uniref:hypothetical protein n=1 Tax=Burkholderia sp. Se-20373 TaxID=2703898 RepID=UPI00197FBAAB|nr:hypothetical protein [Burkholderia sp. Se-20373]MBN3744710.1 hypothetical protein [Burkholderia sp. Se-20373]
MKKRTAIAVTIAASMWMLSASWANAADSSVHVAESISKAAAASARPSAGAAAMVESCAPNGIISMRDSTPVFCDRGVWTVAQFVPAAAAPKRD